MDALSQSIYNRIMMDISKVGWQGIDISKEILRLQNFSGVSKWRLKNISEETSKGFITLSPLQHFPNEIRYDEHPLFIREKGLVSRQGTFSENIRNIALVPIRAEMHNYQLHRFLSLLVNQSGRENLGVVFLINDKRTDRKAERRIFLKRSSVPHPAVLENRITAEFLGNVMQENISAILKLDIPKQYNTLALELIQSGFSRNIRYDYVAALTAGERGVPHFGYLRTYLIDLSQIFVSPQRKLEEVILHLLDVDVDLYPGYFIRLDTWYKAHPSMQANVAESDLFEAECASSAGGDISQAVKMRIKETLHYYRAWIYAVQINNLLLGGFAASAPCISGRASYFLRRRKVMGAARDILYYSVAGSQDDFNLARFMRLTLGNKLGHEEEILVSGRVRRPRLNTFQSDAEDRFAFIDRVNKGIQLIYKIHPSFERKYSQVEWKKKDKIRRSRPYFSLFPQEIPEWLEHTQFLISSEFLEGKKLSADQDYGKFLRYETRLEAQKLSGSGDNSQKSIHDVIAILRAMKRFILAKNLSLLR